MFKAAQFVTTSRLLYRAPLATTTIAKRIALPSVQQSSSFHTTHTRKIEQKVKEYTMAGNTKNAPPAHEMVHFQNLLSSKREFGEFRRVLHTGLYSQLVAMEVPVGGEIGDEVCLQLHSL
jgi:putative ABC transport system ATP-binding protein